MGFSSSESGFVEFWNFALSIFHLAILIFGGTEFGAAPFNIYFLIYSDVLFPKFGIGAIFLELLDFLTLDLFVPVPIWQRATFWPELLGTHLSPNSLRLLPKFGGVWPSGF